MRPQSYQPSTQMPSYPPSQPQNWFQKRSDSLRSRPNQSASKVGNYAPHKSIQNSQPYNIPPFLQEKLQHKNILSSKLCSKQNIPYPSYPSYPSQPYQCQKQTNGSNLLAENQSLRQQLKQMKDKYEGEITQLRRNISLKDELMNQCQKEMGNLKSTYLKLIGQYNQNKQLPGQPQNYVRSQIAPVEPYYPQKPLTSRRSQEIPRGSSAELMPLSMMGKTGSNGPYGPGTTPGQGGKWSHSLIQRR